MGYYCNKCTEGISAAVYSFSIKKFDLPLCMGCHKSFSTKSVDKISSRIVLRPNKKKDKSTPQSRMLCDQLKEMGWIAILEKWDGYKHIDIAIPEVKVNIEVDGVHHNSSKKQALADLKRTFHSFKKGYVTLRIPNSLVSDPKVSRETADYISEFLQESERQLDEEYENEE